MSKKHINTFSWEQFDSACQCLAEQIIRSGIEFYAVYGIPRGGLVVAVRLSHLLNLPLHTTNPCATNLKRTLICDDISDTGKTLEQFAKEGYKITTIHFRKGSKVEPTFYVCTEYDNSWIEYPWESKT